MSGRGVYLGVSHVSHPKKAEFSALPNFGGYPHLMLTPFNAERPNMGTRRLACFRSATPLHLYKCVARFVCDIAEFFVCFITHLHSAVTCWLCGTYAGELAQSASTSRLSEIDQIWRTCLLHPVSSMYRPSHCG